MVYSFFIKKVDAPFGYIWEVWGRKENEEPMIVLARNQPSVFKRKKDAKLFIEKLEKYLDHCDNISSDDREVVQRISIECGGYSI